MHSEGRKKENEVQRLKAWFLAISSNSSFKNKMKETSETLLSAVEASRRFQSIIRNSVG
jgi:hypothetical protein